MRHTLNGTDLEDPAMTTQRFPVETLVKFAEAAFLKAGRGSWRALGADRARTRLGCR